MDMLSSISQASGDKLMKPMAFYCVFILVLRRLLPDFYYSIHLKKSGIAYVLNPFELNSTHFAKDARVWSCRFAEYVAKMT